MEYGEPDEFEVIWQTGVIDHIKAHQVTWNTIEAWNGAKKRIRFMGMFDEHWRLVLDAEEDDIKVIRNLTRAKEAIE